MVNVVSYAFATGDTACWVRSGTGSSTEIPLIQNYEKAPSRGLFCAWSRAWMRVLQRRDGPPKLGKAFPTSPKSALSSWMTRPRLLLPTQASMAIAPAERVLHRGASAQGDTPLPSSSPRRGRSHRRPWAPVSGRLRTPLPSGKEEGIKSHLFQRGACLFFTLLGGPLDAPAEGGRYKVTPRKPCRVCQPQRRRQPGFGIRRRIIPSWATLATSRPSRSNIRPLLKPRPPPLHGLSVA